MPELPEVEVTRRILLPRVRGRRILEVVHQDPARYVDMERAAGQRVLDVRRRGKALVFDLDRGYLVVHLGMSGGFRFSPTAHTRATFVLEDGRLYFHDPRRFGWLRYVERPEAIPLLAQMGPEPFDPEGFQRFYVALGRTRRPIKAVLLDQRVVAGVGNIYSDEALFQAKISPFKPANALSRAEAWRLWEALRDVLARAIQAGGSTLEDRSYLLPDARPGYFQIEHRVYGRTGAPCPVCGTPIERTRIAGRSAHYCPRCQRGGRLASK